MTVEEIIKRLDNFETPLGDLYLYKASPKRRIPFYPPSSKEIHEKIPFDKKTGNVHMLPFDVEIAESCSNEIYKKLSAIKEQIEEKHVESIEMKKISLITGSMFERLDYKNAKHLFSYLRVNVNNTNYDLTGIRFFFDQNDQVNCILLCFQIEMSDSLVDYPNKRENPPKTKDYPHTSYDGEGNKCYYNLDVDIHSDAETIAEKFLEFVKEKEEKAQKKEEPENN